MPAYIVRVKGNCDLVGFYSVTSIVSLAQLVDECIDVDLCEYAEIRDGGVYWSEPAVSVASPSTEEGTDPRWDIWFGKGTLTEDWATALFRNGGLQWRDLHWNTVETQPANDRH